MLSIIARIIVTSRSQRAVLGEQGRSQAERGAAPCARGAPARALHPRRPLARYDPTRRYLDEFETSNAVATCTLNWIDV